LKFKVNYYDKTLLLGEPELPVTKESPQQGSTRKAFIVVGAVFAISVLSLIYVYHWFPELEEYVHNFR